MKITIYGHETVIPPEVDKYAKEKLEKLDKYQHEIIGIELTLEENNHRKNKKIAFAGKALVIIPGNDIKAKAEGKTLFSVVDVLEKKITIQLKKSKDKKTVNKNKLASRSKDLLRRLFRQ
ncbi:MAG: ribosome-associated translation inhibitor RaiA [Patescibacteria group bacterium]|jgi:ribosomal subunit interface protein|nr:ribosome-associated translation inhibitor RaiA [Patescibacteria group bacterium]